MEMWKGVIEDFSCNMAFDILCVIILKGRLFQLGQKTL
jgi:hypothetical protein